MTIHMGYVNPTDRVAAVLITAVAPWTAKVEKSEPWMSGPWTRTQLVLRLIRQVAHQGLSPSDFDNANGGAALRAVADAIFSGKTRMAFFAGISPEWKYVHEAARRILDREETATRAVKQR